MEAVTSYDCPTCHGALCWHDGQEEAVLVCADCGTVADRVTPDYDDRDE